MSAPEVLVRGLSVRLGRREALSGLELAFRPGELSVVVGPNGAGKTTLLRAIAGLVPLRPARSRSATSRSAA